MKIVILGARAVGSHLAKLFSSEGHSVRVIDEDKEILNRLSTKIDILPIHSLLISHDDFINAGIHHTDLFIGVTPSENKNIVACALAKAEGAKKVIARVSHSQYTNATSRRHFQTIGIDEVVCPEVVAAGEILETLTHPNINQYSELGIGGLCMVGIRVSMTAPIANKRLNELSGLPDYGQIVAIVRGEETIIPYGEFVLLPNDLAYIVAHNTALDEIQQRFGFKKFTIKNIIVVGATPIGVQVATRLMGKYRVKLIEQDKNLCEQVAGEIDNNITTVLGDFRDMNFLEEENVKKFDAVISVTPNSETNILFSLLSKRLGIKKTIAEVESTDFIQIAHNLSISSVVNKKTSAVSQIFGHTMKADWLYFKTMIWSEADVIELKTGINAKITKKTIKDISFPKDACIAAIIRGEQHIIPRGHTQIKAGDIVVVFSKLDAMRKVEKLFK